MRSFVMKNASHWKLLAGPQICAALAFTACAAVPVTHAGPMPKEAGVWFDDTGKGAVKIEPCGTKLCGRIVWLKDLVNDKGQPLIDRHNPDASLNKRPICGLQILGQLDAMPEGGFDNGWIYDPKEGKSYSLALTLSGPDELSVTGYKGVKFLSKTFIWKRAKTELPSCAAGPIEAKSTGGAAAPATAAGSAGVNAKVPAKAEAPAAAPSQKSSKAGAGEALPWSSGPAKAAPPTAKVQPQGASNLGGAKLTAPKAPVAKATAGKPAASKAAPVKTAPAKAKSAIGEPTN
ncbi:MAG: DUF2147 domain-containing protein [Hyphomicrobium sp.]|nr:DUF2147 domain-containing protein [Hyphomicrobium sp.]